MFTKHKRNTTFIDLPEITESSGEEDEMYPSLSYDHFIDQVIETVLHIPQKYVNQVLYNLSKRALEAVRPVP
jgi:hypothetical protein